MKTLRIAGLALIGLTGIQNVFAQKVISEATIVYNVDIETGNTGKSSDNSAATTTVYVKGQQSRTDMKNASGMESTIYDAKSGTGVILKEYSGQKLMITLAKTNWETKNKPFSDINFELTNETLVIAGYTCKKAIAKMADGKTFVVYYAPELQMTNKDYNTTFKNLPGLAMQYELETGKMKIKYTVSKISLDPVPAARFDVPKTGYRTMSYEENQMMKKGNG